MNSSDRGTARKHDESPAPGACERESGECAASVGEAAPGCGPNARSAAPIPATSPERRRARRKPFVLRAAGAAEVSESGTTTAAGSRLVRLLQGFGPYLLIEILLPGGTLIAFLLYASRNGRLFRDDAPVLATVLALAGALVQAIARKLPFAALRLPVASPAERDGLEPLAMAPG